MGRPSIFCHLRLTPVRIIWYLGATWPPPGRSVRQERYFIPTLVEPATCRSLDRRRVLCNCMTSERVKEKFREDRGPTGSVKREQSRDIDIRKKALPVLAMRTGGKNGTLLGRSVTHILSSQYQRSVPIAVHFLA